MRVMALYEASLHAKLQQRVWKSILTSAPLCLLLLRYKLCHPVQSFAYMTPSAKRDWASRSALLIVVILVPMYQLFLDALSTFHARIFRHGANALLYMHV